MSKKLKVGIAGAGYIARYHYDCYKRVYGINFEVTGVNDVICEKSKMFAEGLGIKSFDSIEEMLEEVDVIDICTSPSAHEKIIFTAINAGKHIICEKPLIGYAPAEEEKDDFYGNLAPKEPMLKTILGSLREMSRLIKENNITFAYCENLIYSPSIQKEREIIEKSRAKILRMLGEESHNGNRAVYSSYWWAACGGSLISTGSHPIGVLLYLKRVEGEARGIGPIRPANVSARTHELTKTPQYEDRGFIRCNYRDVEDYAWVHIEFEDGTVGDIVTGSVVVGGIYDYVEVFSNNHRARCRMNPVNIMDVYNPNDIQFKDIELEYGISSKEGWSDGMIDEFWLFGYQQEVQNSMECIANGKKPIAGIELAVDTTAVIYSAYLSAERHGEMIDIERID